MRRRATTTIAALAAGALTLSACVVFDLDFYVVPTTSTGGAGGTGGGGCAPGTTRSCYSGPADTEGHGICKAGTQACGADGASWGSCVGEVLPAPEDCTTPEDEDCDGQTPACMAKVLWAKRFGGAEDQVAHGIAVDADGNVLVAGEFAGSIDFGGAPLTSAGSRDAFVVKLDPNGKVLWGLRFGDAADQVARGVAVDAEGNVLVVGDFAGTIDLGGGALASGGSYDVFVAKLAPDGHHLWSARFGDAAAQFGAGIAVDGAGSVIVTGYFSSAMDFGANFVTSAGGIDGFVAKLDADGHPSWAKSFGGIGDDAGLGVSVDDAGNVVVAGYFADTMTFGSDTLTSAGPQDAVVAKIDAAGGVAWAKGFGGDNYQSASSVAMDAAGNAVVTGAFFDSIGFGGGPLLSLGLDDVFVVQLDPSGHSLWSERFGGTSNDDGTAVAIDPAGDVVLAGYFFDTIEFGGGPLKSGGMDDAFLVKLNAKKGGSHVWSRSFGDAATQQATAVAADGFGNVLVTGYFADSIDFDGDKLVSAGGHDVFVAKLGP